MLDVSVNLVAILVAAVVSMFVGMLWYGPLFGKQWMKLANISMKDMKKMPLTAKQAISLACVTSVLMSYVLGLLVGTLQATTAIEGAQVAFWIWLGFAVPIQAGVFLWEGKPFKLFLLNASNTLVTLALMGAVHAVLG